MSSLFDTTLEIRRFEKNYFLYRTGEDYAELRSYIDQADELLDREELNLFTTPEVISGLKEKLRIYGELLGQDASGPNRTGDPVLENATREKGKEMVTTSEQISANRVEINRESLESAKRNLLAGIGLLLVAVFAGGFIFSRKALRPLSVLEKHMVRITAGEFSLIPVKFRIVSSSRSKPHSTRCCSNCARGRTTWSNPKNMLLWAPWCSVSPMS